LSMLRPEGLRNVVSALVRKATPRVLSSWLNGIGADLICVCLGSPADDIALMSACASRGIPYVTIFQANAENFWPDDERAQRLADIVAGARRNFFVSHGNHTLLEMQLGIEVSNLEPTPIKFACVARLDPSAKGQDLLLRTMATDAWRSRPVSVSFFGKGRSQQTLCRLARRLGIEDRTRFLGHVDNIENVWATHHALALPSRFEGLPLAVVEAMLCGRPVVVTDVAGNAEVVRDGVTGFVAESAKQDHLDQAMERAWESRSRWHEMGVAAACSIRKLVPPDPAADFARRLLELINVAPDRKPRLVRGAGRPQSVEIQARAEPCR
jgi:glycosyltransferase involved in cell wall biosynthesis